VKSERPQFTTEDNNRPCPITSLPSELIFHILKLTPLTDQPAIRRTNFFFSQALHNSNIQKHREELVKKNLEYISNVISTFHTTDKNICDFAISDNILIISQPHQLIALDILTKEIYWQRPIWNGQQLWIKNKLAICPSQENESIKQIEFIDVLTGEIKFCIRPINSPENRFISFAMSNSHMTALTHIGDVICWDILTKTQTAHYPLKLMIDKTPVLHITSTHIIITESRQTTIINLTTHDTLKLNAPDDLNNTASTVHDNEFICALSDKIQQQSIYTIELTDPDLISCYQLQLEDNICHMVANDNWIFAATETGSIIALNRNGQNESPNVILNTKQNGNYFLSIPHSHPNYLLVEQKRYGSPGHATYLHLVDIKDMKLAKRIPTNNPSHTLFANGRLFYSSKNKIIECDLGKPSFTPSVQNKNI
jgi:hypothetical protein